MYFKRIEPGHESSTWVECYWVIENDDPAPIEQKIIPDGFPEIIFHFGDCYRINLDGKWETQSISLLAGQIRRYFFLANTGKASMLGIKLKPTALTVIFGISMEALTDRVVDLPEILKTLERVVRNAGSFEERVAMADRYFAAFDRNKINSSIQRAVAMIFETHGMAAIGEITKAFGLSERQLERQFKNYVGLSPKFYSRIVQFNSIFQLHEQGDPSWLDLAYQAGFADQSHFIRNFKAFTGDDPTSYGFEEKNMANFFLKKR